MRQNFSILDKLIDFIHLYHDLTRSIRVGYLELFISCLPKMSNIFFALHHPNYARWMIKFHDELLKLGETHPEVYREFKKVSFCARY